MKVLSFPKSICLLAAAVVAVFPVFSQRYAIDVTLKSRNDTVMLGHYFANPDMRLSDDTVVLKNGRGVLTGNKVLAKGVYFIVNDGRILDFVIGENQQFGIVADTADFLRRTRFVSSPENDAFYEFQRYNSDCSKQMQQLSEQFRAESTTDAEKNDIRTKIQTLNKERLERIEQMADAASGNYTGKFLKALVPVETHLPDPPKDDQGNITDSSYVYRWYRAHFFDNLNVFDPEMLRLPFYADKALEYFNRAVPPHQDSICTAVDAFLTKAQSNAEVFRCLLVTIFNHYVKSKVVVHENVWVHIADKWYIPHGNFGTNADYIATLKTEVAKKQPNLIGKPAPPIEMLQVLPPEHFKAAALDTAIKFDLYAGTTVQDFRRTLKGKHTAILFWDYSCSHCKKFIEELFKVYEEYKGQGFSVITVQTVNTKDAKGKWIDYINDHQMFGWTNAWAPYSNKWRELYDVSSTPKLFLLDSKGNIVIKNIEAETVRNFIDPKPLAAR